MVIVPLHPSKIPALWPEIEGYVDQMAERHPDDWPAEEQVKKALAGVLVFWIVLDEEGKHHALVGTRIMEAPSGRRYMEIATTGGVEHRKWVHLVKTLEDDARRQGCHYIEIRGREGWARYMPDYKLRKEVALTKELS